MRYSIFAEKMLLAMYQETEQTGQPYQKAGFLISKYGLDFKPIWISQMAEEWESSYISDISRVLSGYEDWSFRISAKGNRYIEDRFGDKDGVGTVLEPVDSNGVESKSETVSSPNWTGLSSTFVLTDAKRVKAIAELDKIEGELSGQIKSQHVQAQIRAYIVASRAMLEAPEPQTDVAWELINRAASVASVASLFVSIMQLFV